jgi:hypothetical protein
LRSNVVRAPPRPLNGIPLCPGGAMEKISALLKNTRFPGRGKAGEVVGWVPITTLDLSSGKLWGGDPGFSWAELRRNDGLRVSLEPGVYDVSAFVMAFGKWHVVARLRVCRKGVKEPKLGAAVGETGTDSGAIGVGDAKAVWNAFEAKFGDDEDKPVMFLEQFNFRRVGLLHPNGSSDAGIVYVNCGFGDGSGPVLGLRDGRKRVGVEFVFVEPDATT